jgi:sulfite reductase (NADPH) flavoprotein alpha-component
LSLTVDCVRYVINKRLGLASTFLAERINPGDELKVDEGRFQQDVY